MLGMEEIAERLTKQRELTGLSIAELGRQSGLHQNTIRRMEQLGCGGLRSWLLVSSALKVTLSELLEGIEA